MRRLTGQVRAALPEGSSLCRRDRGDLVALLQTDEEFARRWANEIAAGASLIGVTMGEKGKRIPFAIRAKVAALDPHLREVSTESAA